MSLDIDTKKVVGVLLGGEWLRAQKGTFVVDSYEFWRPPGRPEIKFGRSQASPEPGFTFVEADDVRDRAMKTIRRRFFGPLSAIQGLSYDERPGDKEVPDYD